MLLMIRNFLIVLCIILFSIYMIQYVRTHVDYRKGWIHKAGNLLLYGYLKASITIGYGLEYLRMKLKGIFCSYQPGDHGLKEIYQKEQRINQLKRHMKSSGSSHTEKTEYNLKILK